MLLPDSAYSPGQSQQSVRGSILSCEFGSPGPFQGRDTVGSDKQVAGASVRNVAFRGALILELALSILYHHTYVRVIGGTYGGRRLRSVDGLRVRPTSDRLRETLFNILKPRIADSRFLDICAGSGAVGIEALSRGASQATFIEKSRQACSVIEANLASLGIDSKTILNRDALSAFKRLDENQQRFDIIYFDPPYASDIYSRVLETLGVTALIAADGIVVVEYRARDRPQPGYGDLRIYREVRQGESALAFYARM